MAQRKTETDRMTGHKKVEKNVRRKKTSKEEEGEKKRNRERKIYRPPFPLSQREGVRVGITEHILSNLQDKKKLA